MLPILTMISAGSVVLLTYFGISFWREVRRLQNKRELVVKLRTAITQKRIRNRRSHLYRLHPIELLSLPETKES